MGTLQSRPCQPPHRSYIQWFDGVVTSARSIIFLMLSWKPMASSVRSGSFLVLPKTYIQRPEGSLLLSLCSLLFDVSFYVCLRSNFTCDLWFFIKCLVDLSFIFPEGRAMKLITLFSVSVLACSQWSTMTHPWFSTNVYWNLIQTFFPIKKVINCSPAFYKLISYTL